MRFLVVTLLLLGCGASENRRNLSYGQNAEAAYEAAYEDFEDENCLEAEPEFRRIRREYPYSRYAALAELRVADCLLIQETYTEAITAYEAFVRARPSHAEVPYARFKVSEAYFLQIPEDWLLGPPAHERDQGPTRQALTKLRRFIVDYPEDARVAAAREMSRQALALLAHHELYVAEFYLNREHPQAAIARLESLLDAYMGSGVEPEALLLLGRVYLTLEDRAHARESFERIVNDYPDTSFVEQAREYLEELPGG